MAACGALVLVEPQNALQIMSAGLASTKSLSETPDFGIASTQNWRVCMSLSLETEGGPKVSPPNLRRAGHSLNLLISLISGLRQHRIGAGFDSLLLRVARPWRPQSRGPCPTRGPRRRPRPRWTSFATASRRGPPTPSSDCSRRRTGMLSRLRAAPPPLHLLRASSRRARSVPYSRHGGAGRAAHSRRTLRAGSREPAKKRLFIADSRSPPPRRDGDNKVSVSEERSRPAPAPAVSSPIRLARDQRSLPGRSQRWFGQRSPPCVPLHS